MLVIARHSIPENSLRAILPSASLDEVLISKRKAKLRNMLVLVLLEIIAKVKSLCKSFAAVF